MTELLSVYNVYNPFEGLKAGVFSLVYARITLAATLGIDYLFNMVNNRACAIVLIYLLIYH